MSSTSSSDERLRAKVDRRMRLILKSYGYPPNNDMIAQLIEASNPLIKAHSLQEQIDQLEVQLGVISVLSSIDDAKTHLEAVIASLEQDLEKLEGEKE